MCDGSSEELLLLRVAARTSRIAEAGQGNPFTLSRVGPALGLFDRDELAVLAVASAYSALSLRHDGPPYLTVLRQEVGAAQAFGARVAQLLTLPLASALQ